MSDSAPAPQPEAGSAKRWLVVLAALVVAVVAVGVGGMWFLLRTRPQLPEVVKSDPVAASHANVRGIGFMEQFQYAKAVEAFEEAAKLAPDWTPGKINLGIALLNLGNAVPKELDRAVATFKEVLDRNPDDPYAHYCTGLIHAHRSQFDQARAHFEAVTRIDPNDAHGWYYRGTTQPDSSESREAYGYFEKALKLNPYHNSARYALALHRVTAENDKRQRELMEEFQNLNRAGAHDLTGLKYTEMGRYAEVIGKAPAPAPELGVLPMFEAVKGPAVKLADGTAWATDDKLDDLRKALRERFGGAVVVLDSNRDGKPDVLLLGAVTRGGAVGDLFLRNDGNTFADATADAGLAAHAGSFGAAVGDYDNDGFPDLALASSVGLKLLRNVDGKRFEDRTAAAGFDKESGAFLTAAWADLDQDGDLDLVAAKYATTPELALKHLRAEKVEGGGKLAVFANAGEAPVLKTGQPVPPLSTAFQRVTEPDALAVSGPVAGVVTTDVDGDFDLDLLVLVDGQSPITVLNDRLLRFHRGESVVAAGANWGGGLILDANGDEQPDLVLVEAGAAPRVLMSQRDTPGESLAARFGPGTTDSTALRSAAWSDLDLDGRTDVVGLSADRKPVFLQGDGAGKFTRKVTPFGPEADVIADLLAAVPVDLDGDGNPDLLAWSAGGGLRVFRSAGNGNRGLRLVLTGQRDVPPPNYEGKPLRTNADGVGCWVRLHAGPLRTGAETTTFSAGLGQSRLPIHFGLGKADAAEAVRIRWPDAVIQTEVNQTAGLVTIAELDRKPSSCPVLFVWDGERFAYITDFLGAGSMGREAPTARRDRRDPRSR